MSARLSFLLAESRLNEKSFEKVDKPTNEMCIRYECQAFVLSMNDDVFSGASLPFLGLFVMRDLQRNTTNRNINGSSWILTAIDSHLYILLQLICVQ